MISVIGSRAKDLSGDKSDYDIRVIALYPVELYMLQRAPPTRKIKTELDGVEVEGTCICLQQALKWALETNPAIYDALYSQTLFETDVIGKLKQLFELNYKPNKLRMALAGQIKAYTREKKMGQNKQTAEFKMATEALYLALKLRWVCLFDNEIPPMDIGALIERICQDDETAKEWIFDIVESRKADKNAMYTKTPEYVKFISDSESFSEEFKTEKGKKEAKDKTEQMQRAADELFLEAIGFKAVS